MSLPSKTREKRLSSVAASKSSRKLHFIYILVAARRDYSYQQSDTLPLGLTSNSPGTARMAQAAIAESGEGLTRYRKAQGIPYAQIAERLEADKGRIHRQGSSGSVRRRQTFLAAEFLEQIPESGRVDIAGLGRGIMNEPARIYDRNLRPPPAQGGKRVARDPKTVDASPTCFVNGVGSYRESWDSLRK